MLPSDKELAKWMRKNVSAPVVLAANKCEWRGLGSEAGTPTQPLLLLSFLAPSWACVLLRETSSCALWAACSACLLVLPSEVARRPVWLLTVAVPRRYWDGHAVLDHLVIT